MKQWDKSKQEYGGKMDEQRNKSFLPQRTKTTRPFFLWMVIVVFPGRAHLTNIPLF